MQQKIRTQFEHTRVQRTAFLFSGNVRNAHEPQTGAEKLRATAKRARLRPAWRNKYIFL